MVKNDHYFLHVVNNMLFLCYFYAISMLFLCYFYANSMLFISMLFLLCYSAVLLFQFDTIKCN